MSDAKLRAIAAGGLVTGALLGMAGAFAPSASLRGLAWGIDGTALIVATGVLTVYHLRRGNDGLAAGYLVYAIGEAVITSAAAADLDASAPALAAGTALWAASLALVSAAGGQLPAVVRATGLIAALLFTVAALQLFAGRPLTPLSQPLPFFAFPFLAATLLGWAWAHYRAA